MQQDERRRVVRARTFKAGRIIAAGGFMTYDCTIRNLSPLGAKVCVESTLGIPRQFRLRMLDGQSHECETRWRSGKEVGVVFSDVADDTQQPAGLSN